MATHTALGTATLNELEQELQGALIRPEDAGYDEARAIWNGSHDKRPALIVRCAGVADVRHAVSFARSEGLEVAVRGGGHSIPGFSTTDGGIVIDLSPMKGITVDERTRTAVAEGGLTWAELDAETQKHGLAVTGGLVSTTGVAGFTLGGGIGWLMRKHGLACDNLLAAELVTAGGERVRASATENPELLWALRGGGGNFGVVTALEMTLHPLGPEVLAGIVLYPRERAGELLRAFRDVMRDAPDELSLAYIALTIPDDPDFPADWIGRPAVAVAGMWAGGIAGGERALAGLRGLGDPIADFFGPMPYADFQRMLDDPPGYRNYWTAEQADDLPDELVDAIVAHCDGKPVGPSQLFLVGWGGAMARIGAEHSPLAERGARFVVHPLSLWEDPADDAGAIAWSRAFRDLMAPYRTGGSYLNFLGDEGGDRVRAAFGAERHARLERVKARFDPRDVFRGNHPIA